MAKMNEGSHPSETAPSGDLGLLIEAERKLEGRLGEVQKESGRIVAAAQVAARESEQQLEAELKNTAARRRAELEGDKKKQLEQINEDFQHEASAYDTTSDKSVSTAAAGIVRLLLEQQDGRNDVAGV